MGNIVVEIANLMNKGPVITPNDELEKSISLQFKVQDSPTSYKRANSRLGSSRSHMSRISATS